MNASKFQLVFCVSVIMLNSCMMALADDVDYVRDIKPIFKSKCWSCHGALKQEGTLRIDTVAGMKSGGDSGPALEISDPLNSEIMRRVSSADPDERMPPEGEPVSSEQIERISHWLKSGAAAPLDEQPQTDPTSHWAFQSIATTLPDDSANGAAHPIDSFVDSKLIVAGLQRSPPADAIPYDLWFNLTKTLLVSIANGITPVVAATEYHRAVRLAAQSLHSEHD